MCDCLGLQRKRRRLMDADYDWMRELIEQPAGTAINGHDLAKLRLYMCLAADREVIDLVQVLREAHDATGRLPTRNPDHSLLNEITRDPAILERLVPTRPTRPGTAAGVLELVRRGPDLFKALPVSYQLDALRAVVIRRNREQEEVRFAALQRQQEQVPSVDVPRLRTWVEGQTTELGYRSMGVNSFIKNMLDDDEESEHDFRELLVDQHFTTPELRQMLLILKDKMQIRVLGLKEWMENENDARELSEKRLRESEELLEKYRGDVNEEELVDVISDFLAGIVGVEDQLAEFESREAEDETADEEHDDEAADAEEHSRRASTAPQSSRSTERMHEGGLRESTDSVHGSRSVEMGCAQ